ncbi:uncharacterized protein [Prorops nasuta]|uniref:uncharacterized protein n=1 Tax=Prorops nasuta TaxID=863751 RepID=UPI0034CDF312
MQILWILLLCWSASVVSSFDLRPMFRVAQCRAQCLRNHSEDGSCDWRRGEIVCSECWTSCRFLENKWETTKALCERYQYEHCPSCQTVCSYLKTQVEEKYLPSMLPSPMKGPVAMEKNDVAIVMRRMHKEWKESGYYPGGKAPTLRPDTWIIVVAENGLKHYSSQEWVPSLESLKAGALYEATITWKDVQSQLRKQQDIEQKRFNDRVRQFFLEKYGEKVLSEWRSQEDTQISEDVFRRFFFRRKDDHSDKPLEGETTPSTGNSFLEDKDGRDQFGKKESFVVSWEPEAGGLMGNQVTDSNSAQISLLPGTKYLVRVASNEGPGSFPIEIDTRPDSVQVEKIKKNFVVLLYPWDILTAATFAGFIVLVVVCFVALRRSKSVETEEEEEEVV